MTREQVMQLAGQLYDAMQGGGSGGSGRAPKFDTVLPSGQGRVTYASECSLKELQYQLQRAQKPPKDEKYRESNEKRAKRLGYWVSYRQSNPTEQWRGERNRVVVLAATPSDRPESYERDAPPEPAPSAPIDDDDIPF